MDEKLNRKMDEQLASRVAELDAHNDETGDGKLDAADLKAQLNRIEAQLELQDEQNRSIMKNQRLRMLLTIIITVVLLVVLGLFWNHMDQAYKEVMTACTQVNELADTLQSSLDTLDPDELNNMMQDLPAITEQLKQLDVDSQHKMSKRHGDPSYEDLKAQGFLTPAILNYVALLGWSPRGERAEQEFFTMSELAEAFDIAGISKSPAIFDIEKLTYFNANYIRNMAPEDFARAAEPFIRQSVKNEAYSAAEIAALLQARCERLTDIPEKVDFFDTLPDYDLAFYTNKKSKTDAAVSLEMLQKVLPKLEALNDWSTDGIHDMLIAFAEELGVKNATLMWPLRIACAGKLVTPGGAVEICKILGKDETIRRVKCGIEKLGG